MCDLVEEGRTITLTLPLELAPLYPNHLLATYRCRAWSPDVAKCFPVETQVAGARECVSLIYFMSGLHRSFFVVLIEEGSPFKTTSQSSHEQAEGHRVSSVR